MNEFEVYQTYTALKLHFTTDYDYIKYNGKCKASLDAFNRRRERFFFRKISKEYNDKEVVDFFISQFLDDINMWVGDAFTSTCTGRYKEWKKRIESLQYEFRSDCSSIMSDDPDQFNKLFEVEDGQHPPLLRIALAKKINIETVIILNDILNFIPRWNKRLQDNIIWPDFRNKCIKYKPFFTHDIDNSKNTLKKVLDIL